MESPSTPSPFRADILKGKVALLTGGGSGIGFEISRQLGLHGASVAIMGLRKHFLDSTVSALRLDGITAIGVEGDVRKREDAVRALKSTVKSFGRLDILVNAAAGNFLVPAEDLSPNGFKTGKFINGMNMVVDGGQWLSTPRYPPKEVVKQLSRIVERRSRDAPTGVPKSKL